MDVPIPRDGRDPGADDEEDDELDAAAAAAAERIAGGAAEGTLERALDERAAADPVIERRALPAGVDYLVVGVRFARLDPGGASFRLRPEIAAAAARTEGTQASTLGREWVTFSPRRWDRYALDRATAWFDLARKLAGGRAEAR